MTTPWIVPRDWKGETVAVLASGPSMSMEVGETVRGRCRVIAVNNQGIETTSAVSHRVFPAVAPWADVLYAADAKWWLAYKEQALKFPGQRVTIRSVLPFPEVLSLEFSTLAPYDPRPTHLVSGGNSGYQAVHLAAQRGAARILLCGFDMRAVNGGKHWFGDHPHKNLVSPQRYTTWINNFQRLGVALKALGVEVLNCTPDSALTGFPRAKLKEVFHA